MKTQTQIGEQLGENQRYVSDLLVSASFRQNYVRARNSELSYTARDFHDTNGLPDDDRFELLKEKEEGLIHASELRDAARAIKKLDDEDRAKFHQCYNSDPPLPPMYENLDQCYPILFYLR